MKTKIHNMLWLKTFWNGLSEDKAKKHINIGVNAKEPVHSHAATQNTKV